MFWLAHPATPAYVLPSVAAAVVALHSIGYAPILVVWVVLALSAGYAISGSV